MDEERKPVDRVPAAPLVVIGHELLFGGRLGDAVVRALGLWDDDFSDLASALDRAGTGHRALLDATWALRAVVGPNAWAAALASVRIDPEFSTAVAGLAAAGFEVALQADAIPVPPEFWLGGLHGVSLRSNAMTANDEIAFPHLGECCACQTCTACPQAGLKDARRARRPSVYVGWSLVDRKAALLADRVIAAGPLAQWCDEVGADWELFQGFGWLGATAPSLLRGVCRA